MLKREDAIIHVQDFLKACKQLPIKIDKAILFGSVLSDAYNDDSDIDLALFSSNFTDNILNNLDKVALANIRFPDIDVHTYPTIAYSKGGLLLDEIKKNGYELAIQA